MASVTVTPNKLLLTTTLLGARHIDPFSPPKLLLAATLMRATITTPSTPTGANRAQGHGRSAFSILRRVGI